VRDVKVTMADDRVKAYVVFDVHGKDMTLSLRQVGRDEWLPAICAGERADWIAADSAIHAGSGGAAADGVSREPRKAAPATGHFGPAH